jgi:hypothetical protein
MVASLKRINLALRALMETGIVLALGYWGFQRGSNMGMKFLLGIGTPLLVFGFWGLVDFRQAGGMAESLRLIQELVISGVAALALYVAGQPLLAWALAAVSVVHHALVYLLGGTLLASAAAPAPPSRREDPSWS